MTAIESKGRKRRGRKTLKGRQVDDQALAQIRALLGDAPRRRDLLIEHLHQVQDHYGHLSAAHIAALAAEMGLAQAEVFEVATFYHHFDWVADGAKAPPALTLRVCTSLSCALRGAEALKSRLEATLASDVRVLEAPCVGACDKAPVVVVGQRQIAGADEAKVTKAIAAGDTSQAIPDFETLKTYRARDGFSSLDTVRTGTVTPDEIIAQIDAAGLRGLGGAGFPAARKWGFVRAEPGPRYLCVNADEGEPGTFKDRDWLERVPYQFLEGMAIAAHAVEAQSVYIYLRDEYSALHTVLRQCIGDLERENLLPAGFVHLRRGAGAYICGEESAMIESIEGKRGLPRQRPPYVAKVGLFGRPTLVHNVETLAWIPEIMRRGPAWFAGQGKPGHKGPRSFSVSGRVRDPGVKLAPAGITIAELIKDYCGGMAPGHTFKAYLPGGASGGILPAKMADLPLDFGTLEEHGCLIGSHAIIVLSDQDNMGDVARNLMAFFAHETCGQCTPCRLGCEKSGQLMDANTWDQPMLRELASAMADASICGLGQAAPNPVLSVMRFFPGDVS
ncbi:MAG: NAD(P)H-dependent oxidoreductase subunit E [Alphaproteobacteria bacterium]